MFRLTTNGSRGLLMFALCVATCAPALAADAGYTDRIIVKYRAAASEGEGQSQSEGAGAAMAAQAQSSRAAGIEAAAARRGVTLGRVRTTALGSQVLRMDRRLTLAEAARLAADIANDPEVEYAEPDRILRHTFTPNDSRYHEQWHYFESTGGIGAPAAWDKSTGAGVVVAVIDTGYRPHADLVANILPGYDFISDTFVSNDGNGRDSDARDPGDWMNAGDCAPDDPFTFEASSWHGTHVAGTIAAATNNSNGVAGVAYRAKIVPARVLGRCGGYTSDIADAIVWSAGGSVSGVPANANPAKVLSISLGGIGSCDNTTQKAINTARSRGASVIVAAGNESHNASQDTPANCSGVVTVAAVGRNGGRASYSNYGAVVELAAPGGSGNANGVLSTLNSGTTTPGSDSYAFYNGTSMATPHVSGVVALMLSVKPNLTPDQVSTILQNTARSFPATCSQCGAGIVDASAAVISALNGGAPPADPPGTKPETEPNDSRGASQLVSTDNTTMAGNIGTATDNDYYRITLPAGRTLVATMVPNSASDYDLYVYNSSGTLIGTSDKGTGVTETIKTSNIGTGGLTRYIRVVRWSGGTGSINGRYTLNLDW